jgi:ABC-type nitrate/sulfonate/bicarbonate transport system permease component
MSGLRISLNAAFSVTITTELLISRQGLGARIWMAWETMRTENLYAALIMIALIGILANWALAVLSRRLTPWAPAARLSQHGEGG